MAASHESKTTDLTRETLTPIDRWTAAHFTHMSVPRLSEAHASLWLEKRSAQSTHLALAGSFRKLVKARVRAAASSGSSECTVTYERAFNSSCVEAICCRLILSVSKRLLYSPLM